MFVTRIYQNTSLNVNSNVTLDENASHHLARVLRASIGDEIILFNGDGDEYPARIINITKKNVTIEILSKTICQRESPIDIYLAQGIARGEKMDFIIQKAVELGAVKIFPLVTERCNVRLTAEREEKRLRHWQSIVTSACEQSGRNVIPELLPAQTLSDFITHVSADVKFVLTPHCDTAMTTTSLPSNAKIILLIGPEGGLSSGEIQFAIDHQYQALLLGPRVLRTETATIAALAVLQVRFGDF